MNHQPFENWLLDDEALTPQQQRDLQNHLRGCAACSGIADANLALHTVRLAAPEPGFADRFRMRLAARQREQLRRQAIGTVILVLAGLAMLYAIAGPAMVQAAREPAAWLRDVSIYFVDLLTLVSLIGQVGGILVRALGAVLPVQAWIATLLGGAVLAVFWVETMRRLARVPQGARK